MTLPQRSDGDIIDETDWNAHVDATNTNTNDVATNTSNISSNDSDISGLDSRLTTAESDIGTLQTEMDNAEVRLDDLETFENNTNAAITDLDSRTTALEDPPLCVVLLTTADTSISGGVNLTWEAESRDNDGMWSSGTGVTIQTDGYYEVKMQAAWNGAGGGGPAGESTTSSIYEMYVLKNATGSAGSNSICATNDPPSPTENHIKQITGQDALVAGDVIRARVWADTSSDSYIRGSSDGSPYGGTFLSVRRISD